MGASRLLARIARKGSDCEKIAREVLGRPDCIPQLLEGLEAQEPRTKYGCSKVLRLVSETLPELLYREIDFFTRLLDSENSFLKWDAITIFGNLAPVDPDNRIEPLLGRFLEPIAGRVMITAANVIAGAANIALAIPRLADAIASAILRVERAKYATAECRNVAIGHAINSLDRFFDRIQDKDAVRDFVRRQLANRRNATRRKAAAFLRKRAEAAACL